MQGSAVVFSFLLRPLFPYLRGEGPRFPTLSLCNTSLTFEYHISEADVPHKSQSCNYATTMNKDLLLECSELTLLQSLEQRHRVCSARTAKTHFIISPQNWRFVSYLRDPVPAGLKHESSN